MTITRHPDDSTLLSFAAGSLPGALAVVAAAHVAICARCREEVAMMERMGGMLLDGLSAAPMREPVPPVPAIEHRRPAMPPPAASGEVPPPLAGLVGDNLDALRLRWIAPGLWLRKLPIAGGGQLHLFRGGPGAAVAEHGHEGSELTMVLRGTLSDSTGVYRAGDVCDLGDEIEHTPIAGPEGCICIVAQDHPVRWRGLVARLARPWHGM